MGTAVDVLVGATGKVYGGTTSTLPTSPTGTPDTALHDLGYVNEDGVSQSIGQDTQEIKAWDGSTVRKVQTSHTLEYKLTLLETNPDALAAYYGSDNVDDTDNVVTITSSTNQRQQWVVDVVDGDNVVRIVIPDGEATAHEDVVYKNDTAIEYGITITCYADTDGVKAYKYLTAAGIS